MAAARVHHPDFQHGRPSAESRIPLCGPAGWRLSPAYDLNPVPADIKPRILTTAINEDDTTASLQVALDTANYFGLAARDARAITSEVGAAVTRWRKEADAFGLTKSQTDRMGQLSSMRTSRSPSKDKASRLRGRSHEECGDL